MEYKVGENVYLIASNARVMEVTIVSIRGDFYVVRFPYGGGTQLRSHRLFSSIEEAAAKLPTEKRYKKNNHRIPYDYRHYKNE